MQKRWVLKPKGDSFMVSSLSKVINVSEVIAELLIQRGVHTYDQAKSFFRPDLNDLNDPFLMKDMDKAVNRIETAILKNEKILVYGDYDVDGTTAVSLMYKFLLDEIKITQIDYYIPDRYLEGYGISIQSIDYAKENNYDLVIALDCGIKAVEKIEYANTLGIDFIICDHHRPGDILPKAIAVLDPKRTDCSYPFKELSGCGVGFKLAQAIANKKNIPFKTLVNYLDLVAVSIASDIVPVIGENRILAYYGLKLINNAPKACFEAILKYANVIKKSGVVKKIDPFDCFDTKGFYFNRELTVSDLVFLVGPRINAAGRIESGKNAVKLLICEDFDNVALLADQINEFNLTRRDLDMTTTDMALENIKNELRLQKSLSTVVFNREWHKGVIGIVASRLIESYYRPTIVLTQSNGLITGSARSVRDFDIYDAIDECSDLLEHFGGHKYAAGLSMKPENLDAFIKKFEAVVSKTLTEDMLTPVVEVDSILKLDEITPKFVALLKQFAPFGPGNMSPVFLTQGVIDNGNARLLKEKHLKLTLGHRDYSSNPIPAIAFQLGEYYPSIINGKPFNVCFNIEENEWNNKKELQLNIKDINFEEQVISSPLNNGSVFNTLN